MLKVIPVLDVLGGVAVHAVAGRRGQYRPLKSCICKGSDPLEVASALKSRYGFKDLYVADLDAILDKKPPLSLIQQLKNKANLRLMVDSGVRTIDQALKLLDAGASEVIIGTETLPNLSLIEKVVEEVGENRVIVSVDMKDGKILGRSRAVRSLRPLSLIRKLEEQGLGKFILLDLSKVGTAQGPNLTFIKETLKTFDGEFIVGGGVRDIHDLQQLESLGSSGALLATTLHTNKISKDELNAEGFL